MERGPPPLRDLKLKLEKLVGVENEESTRHWGQKVRGVLQLEFERAVV